MTYFRLEEFLISDTAVKNDIQNLPSWDVVKNLEELSLFLDELRRDWGSALRVTSGFRNERLNKLVGGSVTSAHQIGYAADIQPVNGDMDGFITFIKNWAEDKDFDQIILEQNKKGKVWVHIGLKNMRGQQRHQLFNMFV